MRLTRVELRVALLNLGLRPVSSFALPPLAGPPSIRNMAHREADLLLNQGGLPKLARSASRHFIRSARRVLQKKHEEGCDDIFRSVGPVLMFRMDRRRAWKSWRQWIHDSIHPTQAQQLLEQGERDEGRGADRAEPHGTHWTGSISATSIQERSLGL